MKKHLSRILLYGFLVWLVPFVVAIPFHSRNGELLTDVFLFKTVMIIVGNFTGCVLLALLVPRIEGKTLSVLFGTGLFWLGINWGLDFLILIPMSKMSVSEYFIRIGGGYLTMVSIPVVIGFVVDKRSA
ncbi:hypothetical protein EHQ12_15280 [Leptospira gomenensis]|uniref:Uncharacterized protein n=1 Tax=Leptospira gomenensis TaxID=2484974 RepID=A0A5F1Z323_9LEPT|nr:hypothetical protein [Leptospira gomenensis]TGK28952.1 hypothetical protein EHQ17_16455 [Leptospira gomenensis]TGK35413.1 hypothetical protein EHQ12_15280 [Leptospira gomenensis]TGK40711.1 hypothetical protein EHQ07_17800 [Leptospira gomenensis]TGK68445.1 hypothetical protein EHQ13_00255 [Leptospira gomenensis]